MGWKFERITNAKKPLDRDGESHENTPTHADVAEGMDEEGEENSVDAATRIKSPAGIIDSTADDEDGVEAGKSKEQLMKTVLELGTHEDDNGQDVANNSNKSKDGDKNSIKVISKVLNNGQGDIARVSSTIEQVLCLVHLGALKI